MNEILVEIARSQQLTVWAVGFTAMLTFIGVVVSAVVLYVTRDVWREQHHSADILREVVQISREIHERSERTNYYLFSKLGPLDTK